MNQDVLLGALSALTGATVRPLSEFTGSGTPEELTLHNFISRVLNDKVMKTYRITITELIIKYENGIRSEEVTKSSFEDLNISGAAYESDSVDHTKSPSKDQTKHDSSTTSADNKDSYDSDCYGSQKELFVNMAEFFEPKYNYDFRKLPAKRAEAYRGGEIYTRPCGWYRCALKVLDKYEDGNKWLGPGGWRNQSDPGEWPVSYHGTSKEATEKIIASHYKAGQRAKYGHGIYSTPDISEAEQYYAKTYKTKTRQRYKVILQNRINPEIRKVCQRKDYWLIEIPHDADPQLEKNIVESAIRPYGLLIKEI